MWPAQRGEIQNHRLGILDLGRGDGDGLGRGDGGGRVDDERGGLEAGGFALDGAGRGDFQRPLAQGVHRDGDLVRHFGDPEGGLHRHRVRVGPRRRAGRGPHEKVDVGRSAPRRGRRRRRGDFDGGRLVDGLAHVGVAQDGVGIVQDGLGDGARLDEVGEVLRQSQGVVQGGGLVRERDEVWRVAADEERRDVLFGDVGRPRSGAGGREALGVDGGAVRDGGHPVERLLLHRVGVGGRHAHPEAGFEVDARGDTIPLPRGRIGHVLDGLHVRHAAQKDVGLRKQAPIGHAAQGVGKGERFCRQVELQDVVVSSLRGIVGKLGGGGGALRTEDHVEAIAGKGSLEIVQDEQRRGGGGGGGLCEEFAGHAVDLKAGRDADGGSLGRRSLGCHADDDGSLEALLWGIQHDCAQWRCWSNGKEGGVGRGFELLSILILTPPSFPPSLPALPIPADSVAIVWPLSRWSV